MLMYFRKFYILACPDMLVWGNICQFSGEGQKSVQFQKRRVIPDSSNLELAGNGSTHRSKGRTILWQLFF